MEIFDSPIAGLLLATGSYSIGVYLQKKTRSVFFNPILVALILCIGIILSGVMTLEQFMNGAGMLQILLAPATCAIALSIYRQRRILQENFFPVLGGCLASAVVSIAVSLILGPALGLEELIYRSTIPSAVTSAVAIELAEQVGGLIPIAILSVIVSGIGGAVLAPLLIKAGGLKDEVEIGVSIGAVSHIVGTSKAVELGEVQGAMSWVAIGVSALVTVFLSLFL